MDYKYYHYSNKPLVIDKKYKVYNSKGAINKPSGLWISVNDEWKKWCIEENFHIEELYTQNEIKILDFSKIFISNTIEDIKSFKDKYSKLDSLIIFIDWQKVMKDYDGIIIHNFYDLKYKDDLLYDEKFMWLYSWDIPSGCIWNLNIIEVIDSINIEDEVKGEVNDGYGNDY